MLDARLSRSKRVNNDDAQMAARFVARRGDGIHPGLGGTARLNTAGDGFALLKPYEHLRDIMRQYVPGNTGTDFPETAWDDLHVTFATLFSGYQSSNGKIKGAWYKAGERKEHIEAWVAFIPDAFGLSVVKAGVGLVLKLAEDSVEKRNKIVETFSTLHDTLVTAQAKRRSFQTDKDVREAADRLYVTLVHAIEDLILSVGAKKSVWYPSRRRTEKKSGPPALDIILQGVREGLKTLKLAIDGARDETIENTNTGVGHILHRIIATNTSIEQIGMDLGRQDQKLEGVNDMVLEIRCITTQFANQVLCIGSAVDSLQGDVGDLRSQMLNQVESLARMIEGQFALWSTQPGLCNDVYQFLREDLSRKNDSFIRVPGRVRKPGPVVWLDRFCEILSRTACISHPSTSFEFLRHPNTDLKQALLKKGRFAVSAQAQAGSLLRRDRFNVWFGRMHPGLIFAEGGCPETSHEKLSPISSLCAAFVAGMIRVQPHEVIIHFFSGLHLASNDDWKGPNGLIRSLILQLVMKLVQWDMLSLDFVDDRGYLRALEKHNLESLCQTFHTLLSQFPPETTIYCVIDGISWFDREGMFEDLSLVISCLLHIVKDGFPHIVKDGHPPIFKVLITTPRSCSARVRKLLAPDDIVRLSANNAFPLEISSRVVESRLLRASTPDPRSRRERREREDEKFVHSSEETDTE